MKKVNKENIVNSNEILKNNINSFAVSKENGFKRPMSRRTSPTKLQRAALVSKPVNIPQQTSNTSVKPQGMCKVKNYMWKQIFYLD